MHPFIDDNGRMARLMSYNMLWGVLETGKARRIVSALLNKEVVVSDGPHAPLCHAFPAALAERWMQGLFPEKAALIPGKRLP